MPIKTIKQNKLVSKTKWLKIQSIFWRISKNPKLREKELNINSIYKSRCKLNVISGKTRCLITSYRFENESSYRK